MNCKSVLEKRSIIHLHLPLAYDFDSIRKKIKVKWLQYLRPLTHTEVVGTV